MWRVIFQKNDIQKTNYHRVKWSDHSQKYLHATQNEHLRTHHEQTVIKITRRKFRKYSCTNHTIQNMYIKCRYLQNNKIDQNKVPY